LYSGAESVEAAVKTARRYHYVNDAPQRNRIITFEGAFHGRTLATISAGGQEKYLEGFAPRLDGFDQVPFGDHDALHAAINEHTAGILIEPVQGEGGVRMVPDVCLQGVRKLCDEHGLLMIVDEVQTGMMRTGRLFAHEHAGVKPDIVSVAKGIGGGFPLGACLTTAEAGKGMTFGTHGTTFGGNPLAMSVANAVLDVMLDPSFVAQAQEVATYFDQGLVQLAERHHDHIDALRGRGFIRGLRLGDHIVARDVLGACAEASLLVCTAGDNVLRLLPPVIADKSHIDEAMAVIDGVLGRI
jgi:Ornithine/acetylornithine aminotransferase